MKEKRIQEIKKYIDTYELVSIESLCEKFNMSKNTIRRDINILEQQGAIQKVYGGVATLHQKLPGSDTRGNINPQAKDSIVRSAATLIQPNELIFIDAGTTTKNIVKYFPRDFNFTVLTNSFDIIESIVDFDNVNLVVIGNIFRRKTRSFTGDGSLSVVLNKYNINKAFMASSGLSIENGLTNYDVQEHELKSAIVQRSRKVFLLADESKFGRDSLLTYAHIDDLAGVITSSLPSDEYVNYFEEHHIQLIIAK
ncbi:DeoR/GlpR family DNA-binding transcription regulator [Zophobihabitans entericus]|uniref:DeoR/GlpR transcriptional regulator n=1 Tax=Zophobihabitans entericus TaxID=1635327 RepID=A0A6G9ICT3_9GAMM|nr:DeoR/GlpR family DNA-binding transcription regulator [Zophobihabitans entericus]QIQ22046.1 DeoR/GlpR transcriptional regulator [Zophobihabitans entericus]